MQVSEAQYRAAVLGVAALAVLLMARLRFCNDLSLPPKPPKPTPVAGTAKELSKSVERNSAAYEAYLKKDSEAYGISAPSARAMSVVFPHETFSEHVVLEPGSPVERGPLVIELRVDKPAGAKRKQLNLHIENRSHKPLAYRVKTRPSAGSRACSKMRALRHNAVALAAGGSLERAECQYRKGWTLELLDVDVMELPELGYMYLSSVQAEKIGLDRRTSLGHQIPVDSMGCRIIHGTTIQSAIDDGDSSWRDVVDFYARHRCKTYTFHPGYKAFQTDGERSLPDVVD
jgi:hypothetical protein